MSNPWDGFIPQETLDHYRNAGLFKVSPLGTKPALLVIDMQYSTTGEGPMPLSEAIAYHPMNCGEFAWNAIAHIKVLLAAFREAGLPVIYPHIDRNRYSGKHSRMPTETVNARHFDIVEEIAPVAGDIMLPKTTPSAFFGTPLVKYLHSLKVDTLFMVGNTTSGCIRASVIDGMAYDYKVVVPHEACYDRAPISHAVNLFDMASKYADVVSIEKAMAMVKSFTPTGRPADSAAA